MECLQLRKLSPLRSRLAESRGKPTYIDSWGRPMTQGKKQVKALCGTAVAGDRASGEGFAEITSGRSRCQQGLVATCKGSSNEAKPKEGRSNRDRRMSP
jgi:hypothetical protein